jgi:hypothetical protein
VLVVLRSAVLGFDAQPGRRFLEREQAREVYELRGALDASGLAALDEPPAEAEPWVKVRSDGDPTV